MNNNDESKVVKKQLQDAFDALAILMNSQTQSQEDIKNAVKRSMQLHQTIERTVSQFTQDVPNTIKDAAATSSNIISTKVIGNLQELDKKVQQTANTLDDAAQNLGWKIFGIGFSVIFLCFMMMSFVIIWYVPSLDEVASRRVELEYLEKSIQDLKKQATISTCKIDENTSLPCIRIKEIKGRGPWGSDGENYQLIWQGK